MHKCMQNYCYLEKKAKKDLYSNGFKDLQFCGIENHDIANIVLG